MTLITGPEAIALIRGARTADDLFGPCADDEPTERRRIRTYRRLAFVVHPDRAVSEGLSLAEATAATKRLTALRDEHAGHGTRARTPSAHVQGLHGVYLLRERLRSTDDIAVYATDVAGVRIDIARRPLANSRTHVLGRIRRGLERARLGGFVPEVVDAGEVDGRAWTAHRTPDGLVPLRDVRAAYPAGLDGRDWAWMARRLLLVRAAAPLPHGGLDLDTVQIHPSGHRVMVTGWGRAPSPATDATHDGRAVADLFDALLDSRPDSQRQRAFAAASVRLPAERVAHEYDLLLNALYGARRHRPFSLPRSA